MPATANLRATIGRMGDLKPQIHLAADEPWERQPGETEAMHARYLAYQNQGLRRAVRRVADDCGKSVAYLQRVAWRYRWTERATAWDREQQRQFVESLTEERRTMVEDHLKLSKHMLEKVAERLDDLDPAVLTAADLARWAEVLTKIRANVLGEPTHTVAVQGTPGGPPVQLQAVPMGEDERRAELERVRERLLAALSEDDLTELDPAALDDGQVLDDDDEREE